MIASGVVVYVPCQPVSFRKGAASLMALVRDGGLDPFQWRALRLPVETGRPYSYRLVGWQWGLPLFENPGRSGRLLARHIDGTDPSGPFAADGVAGRNGLEKDPPDQGQATLVDGLTAPATR